MPLSEKKSLKDCLAGSPLGFEKWLFFAHNDGLLLGFSLGIGRKDYAFLKLSKCLFMQQTITPLWIGRYALSNK